jgi:hypothetical protein
MRPPRSKPAQLDLFGPPNGGRPPDVPRWRSLPERTRRRATILMARMLLAHRGAEQAGAGTDARREGGNGDV